MGAFIVAGLVEVVTLAVCFLYLLVGANSPTGLDGPNPLWPFVIGTAIAGLIAATHFLPSIGW